MKRPKTFGQRVLMRRADENCWLGNGQHWLNVLLMGGLLPALAACTATVSCPDADEDPRSAYFLKHGRHPTLMIADREGALTRYGYGDWRYYAQADTSFGAGVRALLWPSPAALGRQHYPAIDAPTAENIRRAVKTGISELHAFKVSGQAADTLRSELETLFSQGAQQKLLRNKPYDFEFVPHPRAYWLGHNSNGMVADWLDALGCQVSDDGAPLRIVVE